MTEASGQRRLQQSAGHKPNNATFPIQGLRRSPQQAADATPLFDVNGDGIFSAADYALLVQLGLAWSNDFGSNAEPWLQEFRRLTGSTQLTDWQLQSTDPDFMYMGSPCFVLGNTTCILCLWRGVAAFCTRLH